MIIASNLASFLIICVVCFLASTLGPCAESAAA